MAAPETTIPSPLLSIPDTAKYLKIGLSTLYTRLGELEVVKFGSRSLITRRSIDALIERSTRPANTNGETAAAPAPKVERVAKRKLKPGARRLGKPRRKRADERPAA